MTLKPPSQGGGGGGGGLDYSRLYRVNSKNILLDSSATKMFIEK
jgi:hypothetical protein